MKKLILFGNGKIADVVFYYFNNHSKYNVVAFTCDRDFIVTPQFNGLPVIPFEEIEERFPPSDYCMFIAIGYQDLNNLRTKKYMAAKEKGYNIISFIHPQTDVPNNVEIGENTIIMNNAVVQPCVKIGNNVFVWGGTVIGHHSIVGDNCWLTSSTNVSGNVVIGKNCFFGINATLGHSIKIGDNCFIGANALQVKNLANDKVVIAESSKVIKLSSKDFLRFSNFGDL